MQLSTSTPIGNLWCYWAQRIDYVQAQSILNYTRADLANNSDLRSYPFFLHRRKYSPRKAFARLQKLVVLNWATSSPIPRLLKHAMAFKGGSISTPPCDYRFVCSLGKPPKDWKQKNYHSSQVYCIVTPPIMPFSIRYRWHVQDESLTGVYFDNLGKAFVFFSFLPGWDNHEA